MIESLSQQFEPLFDRAMTFDGYEHVGGGPEEAESLMMQVRAEWVEDGARGRSPDDLRAALFAECRRLHSWGCGPSPRHFSYLLALDALISARANWASAVSPWDGIIGRPPPWVLPTDEPHIAAYNRSASTGAGNQIDVSLLPEPWVGDLEAPVVVLNLNPGIGSPETADWHSRASFQEAVWENLAQTRDHFPLFYLEPALADGPGARWWRRCLKSWIAEFGDVPVAANVAGFEFHGYHSQNYGPLPVTLPSQAWLFDKLRERIDLGAVIVGLRGKRAWMTAVPELVAHPMTFWATNPQSASVSRKNLGQAATDAVYAALASQVT